MRLADGFIFFGAGGIEDAVDSWTSVRERLTNRKRSVEDVGGEYAPLSQGVESLTKDVVT